MTQSLLKKEELVKFILDCQDVENGGISDRPDDVDIFHTYFGVSGNLTVSFYFSQTCTVSLGFSQFFIFYHLQIIHEFILDLKSIHSILNMACFLSVYTLKFPPPPLFILL